MPMAPNPRNGEQMSCTHDHWHVADSHPIGQCYCDDCGRFIGLAQAFDRLRERAEEIVEPRIGPKHRAELEWWAEQIGCWPRTPKLKAVYDAIMAAIRD